MAVERLTNPMAKAVLPPSGILSILNAATLQGQRLDHGPLCGWRQH